MMSPGTYTAGTQPVATYYATPMPNTMYTTYVSDLYHDYPMTMRRGLFGMRSTPMYYYPSTPVTTTYSTPVQTYTRHAGPDLLPACPAKVWPVPALRQQAMPAYTAPVYGTPVYSTSGYAAPVYTTYTATARLRITRQPMHRRPRRSPRTVR